jgi:hypothetical protein
MKRWFTEGDHPMRSSAHLTVEEHVHGDTRWVAVRARGAEWSWLTPEEAAELGRQWVEAYGGGKTPKLTLVETGKWAA